MNTTIQTTRFGEIEIDEAEHLISFEDGVIGFPTLKKYVLIESNTVPLILWLQSTEAADIAFPVSEPWFFRRDHKTAMNDSDKHTLKYQDTDRLKVFVILTIPTDMTKMTANLKAPVVLNITKATGAQVILQDKTLEVRTPAFEALSRALSNLIPVQSTNEVEETAEDSWTAVNVRGREASVEALSVVR